MIEAMDDGPAHVMLEYAPSARAMERARAAEVRLHLGRALALGYVAASVAGLIAMGVWMVLQV